MDVRELDIPGVLVVTPPRFGDARGWFCETFSAPKWAAAGIDVPFVQDNQSFSAKRGTLRGLHYQAPPFAQDKLVRCTRGRIWDAAVDVRTGSPTYGRWVGAELTAEKGEQIFVPAGFLHGFVTLEADSEVSYKVSALYSADADGGVAWDDPDIGIDWPIEPGAVVLSDKDAKSPRLADISSPFTYQGS